MKKEKADRRKARIRALEEERKKKKKLTAEEIEDEHFKNATLKRAHDLRVEQIDQVKNMVSDEGFGMIFEAF